MKPIANISGETSVLLDSEGDLELWLLGLETKTEFNNFVLKVYSDAFTDESFKIQYSDIAESTEEYFHRARVCGVRHKSGQLIGTWGLILKSVEDREFQLPIEIRYNLPIQSIVEKFPEHDLRYAFNGWRAAVDKDALEKNNIQRNKSIFVFDFLIRGLTMDFPGKMSEYLGVSELEKLVFKYHRRVGIPWQIIGEPVHFWNRDRYPCAFLLGEFVNYLQKFHPERFDFIYKR